MKSDFQSSQFDSTETILPLILKSKFFRFHLVGHRPDPKVDAVSGNINKTSPILCHLSTLEMTINLRVALSDSKTNTS